MTVGPMPIAVSKRSHGNLIEKRLRNISSERLVGFVLNSLKTIFGTHFVFYSSAMPRVSKDKM